MQPQPSTPPPRWLDAFVICGLPHSDLRTIHGEPGFRGLDTRYQPSILDSLTPDNERNSKLPLQLATV
jgi:hypothetical protein